MRLPTLTQSIKLQSQLVERKEREIVLQLHKTRNCRSNSIDKVKQSNQSLAKQKILV